MWSLRKICQRCHCGRIEQPQWHGIPFFYWYQLLWVIIAAVLTAVVYLATEASRR